MASFDVDFEGLDEVVRELGAMGDRLESQVRPVVAKGALNVKTSLREDMAGSRHFGQVARSITYDTRSGQGWVEAQIGPETAGATVGDLAHFAYFGGANGGGGSVRDPQAALDEEAPRFVQAVGAVLDGLIGR